MAANFTISQPDGVGSAALNFDLREVWAGVPVLFDSAAYGSYSWALVKRPTGGNPAVGNPSSQQASVTFPAIRGRYQMRLVEPAGSRILTVDVTRDSEGEPLPGFPWSPPSQGEKASYSPSLLGRGVQRLLEELKAALDDFEPGGGGGVADAPAAGAFGATAAGPGEWLTVSELLTLLAVYTASEVDDLIDAAASALDTRLDAIETTSASQVWGRFSAGAAGWLSAVAAATASTIVARDSNADAAFRRVEAERLHRAAGTLDVIATNGALTITEVAGHGFNMSTAGAMNLGGSAATRVGGAGQTTLIFGSSRKINRYFYADGQDRANEVYPAVIQTLTDTPASLADIAATARGVAAKRVIRARVTLGGVLSRASWTFYYDAHLDDSGDAQWTGGDAPVAVNFVADPSLADCQCELVLNGANIRSMVTGLDGETVDWTDAEDDKT